MRTLSGSEDHIYPVNLRPGIGEQVASLTPHRLLAHKPVQTVPIQNRALLRCTGVLQHHPVNEDPRVAPRHGVVWRWNALDVHLVQASRVNARTAAINSRLQVGTSPSFDESLISLRYLVGNVVEEIHGQVGTVKL